MLALCVFRRCLRARRRSNIRQTSDTEQVNLTSGPYNCSLIEVEDVEDISTLGDPVYPPDAGGMYSAMCRYITMEGHSTISPVYDYNMAYAGAGDMSSVSTTGGMKSVVVRKLPDHFRTMSETDKSATQQSSEKWDMRKQSKGSRSFFSDDYSLEGQDTASKRHIRIVAPPGKLGVVIDTPCDGVPMVHAIKDTSVLVENLRVCDRLLSVDGEDTTSMSATQVSRLISSRSRNPSRVLVFLRAGLVVKQHSFHA